MVSSCQGPAALCEKQAASGAKGGEPGCLEHRELWWWLAEPGPLAAGGASKAQTWGWVYFWAVGRGWLCKTLSAAWNMLLINCCECLVLPEKLKTLWREKGTGKLWTRASGADCCWELLTLLPTG